MEEIYFNHFISEKYCTSQNKSFKQKFRKGLQSKLENNVLYLTFFDFNMKYLKISGNPNLSGNVGRHFVTWWASPR